MKNFIRKFYRVPYCVPSWGVREHLMIFWCLLTGKLIRGNYGEKLFKMVKQKTGLNYVFGFSSGADAINAALRSWGVGKHDKVILPSYLCESVIKAVLDTDAEPLFCDIAEDYNPNVDHIVDLIDKQVKAIVFPHLFGNPAPIDRLESEMERRTLRSRVMIIDDAAQSFGAILNGKLVGTFGDVGIISFGPGKTMTASGGGLLITNSESIAQRVQEMEIVKESYLNKLKKVMYWLIFRRWRRYTSPFLPYFRKMLFSQRERPPICCISNIDAAIAKDQLEKLDKFLTVRTHRKQILDQILNNIPAGLIFNLPENDIDKTHINVATKYIFRLESNRDYKQLSEQINIFFSEEGIEIRSLYHPLHLKQEYQKYGNTLPNTNMYWNKIIQIPLEPSMGDRIFEKIQLKLLDILHVLPLEPLEEKSEIQIS